MPDHAEQLDRLKAALADRYRIERELGAGGMATVYLAHDVKHDRRVGIKVLKPELAAVLGAERFVQEIKTTANLQHPHILPLFDSGEADGFLYYVMPFIDGETLRNKLNRETQLGIEEAVKITTEVADALDYAHRHGVIHRDIKPENIMLHEGHAMVADFGIGKAVSAVDGDTLTQTGVSLGTPAYMSPEQAAGDAQLDGRGDLYSLGCVLYEMLTGEPPFTGASAQAVIAKRFAQIPLEVTALRPGVPPPVSQAVARALQRAPVDRFATGAEFGQTLDTGVRTPAGTGPGAGPAAKSIAVLPFANMSADPENQFFADGITEEIINVLAQLPGLHVVARTSSFVFKGDAVSVREVGAKLHVASVLQGSVRRAGNRLRITAQLINVADGYHLWSERYDRELHDVFAVQDEIAETIRDRLELSLTRDPRSPLVNRPTDDVTAYELYLKGRFLWNKRTKASLEQAVECFEGAIARDPGFALAHSGLADTRLVQGAYSHLALSETRRLAKAAAERALALNASAAEVQASYGQVLRLDHDWAGEEAAYRRALQLNPNYAIAHAWYAQLLGATGRHAEAAAEIDRARHLDPLSYVANVTAGLLSLVARQYEAAIRQLHHTVDLEPPDSSSAHAYLSVAYLELGRTEDAIREYEIVESLAPEGHTWALGAYVLARAGDVDAARGLLQQSVDVKGYTSTLALAYGALGDTDQAFALLDRSVEEGSSWGPLFYVKVYSMFDFLRGDARFSALLERLGLLD